MLVWFVYATKSQRATAQSRAATLSRDEGRATKSRDKIAGVTSVLQAVHTYAALLQVKYKKRFFNQRSASTRNAVYLRTVH